MASGTRYSDRPLGIIELVIGRDVTDGVLIADVRRYVLADRHNLAGFLGQERLTPRSARDLPENSRVAALLGFVEQPDRIDDRVGAAGVLQHLVQPVVTGVISSIADGNQNLLVECGFLQMIESGFDGIV